VILFWDFDSLRIFLKKTVIVYDSFEQINLLFKIVHILLIQVKHKPNLDSSKSHFSVPLKVGQPNTRGPQKIAMGPQIQRKRALFSSFSHKQIDPLSHHLMDQGRGIISLHRLAREQFIINMQSKVEQMILLYINLAIHSFEWSWRSTPT